MSELRNFNVDEMMQAYRDMGYDVEWIADKYGYSKWTIYKYTEKPVKPECDDHYLMQWYRDLGFACERIAGYFKVSTSEVEKNTVHTLGVVSIEEPHTEDTEAESVEEDKAEAPEVESEQVESESVKVESEEPEKPQPTYPGKDTTGKARLSLVPPGIIEAVGEVRTFGCKKYGASDNWKTVKPEFYVDALMRHLVRYLRDPKAKDPESGLSHLAHMATNIAFLIEMEDKA